MKNSFSVLLLLGAVLITDAVTAATLLTKPERQQRIDYEKLRELLYPTNGASGVQAAPPAGNDEKRLRQLLYATNRPGNVPGRSAPQEKAPTNPPANTQRSNSERVGGTSLPGAAGAKYALREGDFIEVKVYQEEDLTAQVRLNQEGDVTLPLLGTVPLKGKSVEQAKQQIQGRLTADYLVNPQVTVTVLEYAKRRFSVMGQVQQPGFYNIPENEKLNVLQAISMAGGFTRLANTSRVTIKRNLNGKETVVTVNAQSMGVDGGSRLMEVEAEDTIIVHQRIF